MRNPLGDYADELADWYTNHVRPLLEQEEPNRLVDFDADLERLRTTRESRDEELAVCFLGVSGVGKSTLINALIAGGEMVLPSGGIGPLTAQALTVRKGAEPRFEAQYHPPKKLNKVLFVLERSIAPDQEPEPAPATAERDDAEIRDEIRGFAGSGDSESQSKTSEYIKQARLIITGKQDGDDPPAYLADGLRTAMGMCRKWGTEPRAEDEARLVRVQAALVLARSDRLRARRADSPSDWDFKAELKDHASGFLAPLIQKLEVVWDSTTLPDHVALVDLPGVGIADDVYRNVTQEWIRERARVVVLVVGKSGLTEADAQLLHSSGFLNRLLYSIEDPELDPIPLMVAVTRVDDSAVTRWAEERAELGPSARKKPECFAEICRTAEAAVREQLRPQLEKAWAALEIREGQKTVINQLVERLEVHPLSAIEFRRALINDEEDRSFLANPEQSNVPRLLESLRRLAERRRAAEAKRVDEACAAFEAKLVGTLEVVRAHSEEESRASLEAGRLKEEFLVFLKPRREEFLQRRGALRNFFKETLSETIQRLVDHAREEARKEIRAYLRGLEDAHHSTLKAAVSKGGIHYGARHINLPNDFALRFESPVAEAWGRQVLQKIRGETTRYANACIQLVDEVAAWAKEQEDHFHKKRLVEARRGAVEADMRGLKSVGNVKVNELRERVNRDLIKGIEGLIRRECGKFVDQGLHSGLGMKRRTIELFGELAEQVSRVARDKAVAILKERCDEVLEEVQTVLRQTNDPLKTVEKAVLDSLLRSDQPEDEERRGRILEAVDSVFAAAPDPTARPEEALA